MYGPFNDAYNAQFTPPDPTPQLCCRVALGWVVWSGNNSVVTQDSLLRSFVAQLYCARKLQCIQVPYCNFVAWIHQTNVDSDDSDDDIFASRPMPRLVLVIPITNRKRNINLINKKSITEYCNSFTIIGRSARERESTRGRVPRLEAWHRSIILLTGAA